MSYDDWKLANPPDYDLPELIQVCSECSEDLDSEGMCHRCRIWDALTGLGYELPSGVSNRFLIACEKMTGGL